MKAFVPNSENSHLSLEILDQLLAAIFKPHDWILGIGIGIGIEIGTDIMNVIISTSIRSMALKLSRVVTRDEDTTSSRSRGTSITLSHNK